MLTFVVYSLTPLSFPPLSHPPLRFHPTLSSVLFLSSISQQVSFTYSASYCGQPGLENITGEIPGKEAVGAQMGTVLRRVMKFYAALSRLA